MVRFVLLPLAFVDVGSYAALRAALTLVPMIVFIRLLRVVRMLSLVDRAALTDLPMVRFVLLPLAFVDVDSYAALRAALTLVPMIVFIRLLRVVVMRRFIRLAADTDLPVVRVVLLPLAFVDMRSLISLVTAGLALTPMLIPFNIPVLAEGMTNNSRRFRTGQANLPMASFIALPLSAVVMGSGDLSAQDVVANRAPESASFNTGFFASRIDLLGYHNVIMIVHIRLIDQIILLAADTSANIHSTVLTVTFGFQLKIAPIASMSCNIRLFTAHTLAPMVRVVVLPLVAEVVFGSAGRQSAIFTRLGGIASRIQPVVSNRFGFLAAQAQPPVSVVIILPLAAVNVLLHLRRGAANTQLPVAIVIILPLADVFVRSHVGHRTAHTLIPVIVIVRIQRVVRMFGFIGFAADTGLPVVLVVLLPLALVFVRSHVSSRATLTLVPVIVFIGILRVVCMLDLVDRAAGTGLPMIIIITFDSSFVNMGDQLGLGFTASIGTNMPMVVLILFPRSSKDVRQHAVLVDNRVLRIGTIRIQTGVHPITVCLTGGIIVHKRIVVAISIGVVVMTGSLINDRLITISIHTADHGTVDSLCTSRSRTIRRVSDSTLIDQRLTAFSTNLARHTGRRFDIGHMINSHGLLFSQTTAILTGTGCFNGVVALQIFSIPSPASLFVIQPAMASLGNRDMLCSVRIVVTTAVDTQLCLRAIVGTGSRLHDDKIARVAVVQLGNKIRFVGIATAILTGVDCITAFFTGRRNDLLRMIMSLCVCFCTPVGIATAITGIGRISAYRTGRMSNDSTILTAVVMLRINVVVLRRCSTVLALINIIALCAGSFLGTDRQNCLDSRIIIVVMIDHLGFLLCSQNGTALRTMATLGQTG